MLRVSVLGFDSPARAELRRILERAGVVIVGDGEPSDGTIVPAREAGEELAPPESLTPREGEVLELLAEGLSNRRVAERLAISEHTVKFHVASIYGKLGASSRAELIRRAARRGLITI